MECFQNDAFVQCQVYYSSKWKHGKIYIKSSFKNVVKNGLVFDTSRRK